MPPVEVNEDEVEALADYMYEYAEEMMVRHGVKRYSYEEALKKAKAEGKIVLIEGYIPFCRGCIWMDRNVMVEPKVKEALNRDFVLVKMNLLIEKLPLGMKRLGTPSFYFIDPYKEKMIDMLEGTGTVQEFLSLLDDIVHR
jgi:thiol:disulfide interchange protein